MRNKHMANWLLNIFNTQDEEISCSECFDQVSTYVEAEVSGGKPEASLSEVKHHLAQCPACREEYETLRDLRDLENEGEEPSVDELRQKIQ